MRTTKGTGFAPASGPWLLTVLYISAALVALYFLWGKEFIAIDRCLDAGGRYEEHWQTCDLNLTEFSPQNSSVYTGPVFSGVLYGDPWHLQIRDDFQHYRLIKNGMRWEGDVNTEKGFEQDDNAVVYVLDWMCDEPKTTRLLVDKKGGVDQLRLIGHDRKLQKDVALRAASRAQK